MRSPVVWCQVGPGSDRAERFVQEKQPEFNLLSVSVGSWLEISVIDQLLRVQGRQKEKYRRAKRRKRVLKGSPYKRRKRVLKFKFHSMVGVMRKKKREK